MKWTSIVLFCCIFSIALSAQIDSIPERQSSGFEYPPVNEDKLVETYWKYTYTVHAEDNIRIHQADSEYQYFLYFNYEYIYRQFLNGKETRGTWLLNKKKNELFYDFRNIKWWKIAEFTDETLVLEFSMPNNKNAVYHYHFIRANPNETPFERESDMLPIVGVEDLANDPRIQTPKKPKKEKDEEIFIEIALVGGGYYGGVDPVLKDFILIKNNGKLIKEFESVEGGLKKTKKKIPREEVERLAEFIISKKFFEYERLYDCESNVCRRRQNTKPTPIPLRLSMKYGSRYKSVTVTIWGLDAARVRYVDYPSDLDLIIKGIQSLADY